jgi:hypothetical protein
MNIHLYLGNYSFHEITVFIIEIMFCLVFLDYSKTVVQIFPPGLLVSQRLCVPCVNVTNSSNCCYLNKYCALITEVMH